MSTFEKAKKKFNEKPIPNNIRVEEAVAMARHYGCRIDNGGKHKKIVCDELGIRIPIPVHGKYIDEAYVKQLKELFETLDERSVEQ